jgi:hypothetical protein
MFSKSHVQNSAYSYTKAYFLWKTVMHVGIQVTMAKMGANGLNLDFSPRWEGGSGIYRWLSLRRDYMNLYMGITRNYECVNSLQ